MRETEGVGWGVGRCFDKGGRESVLACVGTSMYKCVLTLTVNVTVLLHYGQKHAFEDVLCVCVCERERGRESEMYVCVGGVT